ncbi:hypothetical protein GOBAR_AA29000 [Gossypium barbadense]|uniref:Uncharacterized protein n=1 Tax=Gossypium barbadense TaxID=3634 RepID=A0A2P5WKU4_GOSBA|nr:hypothetical protein GOBAR_AA29000 [Gossypium barbadense]
MGVFIISGTIFSPLVLSFGGLIIRDRWATANGKAPTDLNQPAKTGVTWERGVGGKAETLKGTWEGIDVWASSITRAEEAHMANFQ